jgi:hypothetical protein
MFSKNKYSLLLHYLIIWPIYYVVAMVIAVLILSLTFDWPFYAARNVLLVLAICWWIASYIIHFRVLSYAIGELMSEKSKIK